MRRVNGSRSVVLALAAIIFVSLLPLWLTPYWLFIATSGVIASFTALSVGVVSGRGGMISLCQLSFAAIGVWFVFWLHQHGVSLPAPLLILCGGLITIPFGVLVGIPALRLRGVNIAIVTLGVASVVDTILNVHNFPGVLQGAYVPRGVPFEGDSHYYWMCWAMLLGAVGLVVLLGRLPIGASWLAIRHSERGAAALGVHIGWAKLSAFGTAAFIAGLGGTMLMLQLGTASTAAFAVLPSLAAFTLAVLFGARFPEGAMFAGAATVLAPELLRRIGLPADIGDMLFAVGTIHALRKGEGVAEALRARASRRRTSAVAVERTSAEAAGPESSADRKEEVAPTLVRPQGPVVLALEDLKVSYGSVTALEAVNLEVKSDEVAALIGPNGAGKTTLVDAVSGFVGGYGGRVLLGGEPIDGLGPAQRARKGLRRTFQQGLAVPELTVRGYLQLAARRRMSSEEVEELMEFVGGPGDQMIANVDVGARRLIEVAANLAARPRVLLLDEPGAGLAARESLRLARQITSIPARFGCGVLLIEHDMTMVAEACTSIVALNFGKVIAAGSVSEVLQHEDVVDAYLGGEAVTA